jgi:hypothetical protein
LEQYCFLSMEMALDSPIKTKANNQPSNFGWCGGNIRFVIYFSLVYYFIKFNKLWHGFMCDFVATMRNCQGKLYAIYFDPIITFRSLLFH